MTFTVKGFTVFLDYTDFYTIICINILFQMKFVTYREIWHNFDITEQSL